MNCVVSKEIIFFLHYLDYHGLPHLPHSGYKETKEENNKWPETTRPENWSTKLNLYGRGQPAGEFESLILCNPIMKSVDKGDIKFN